MHKEDKNHHLRQNNGKTDDKKEEAKMATITANNGFVLKKGKINEFFKQISKPVSKDFLDECIKASDEAKRHKGN